MSQELYLAFDIETVPLDWNSLSESQQEYLLRGANSAEEIEKKKSEMALSPLSARCVCIGMQLMQNKAGNEFELANRAAFAVDDSVNDETIRMETLSGGDTCYLYNEKRMLEDFWRVIKKYEPVHLISFNGRNFDAPFLMLRSALLGVKPSRNLMSGTKFNYSLHTDLLDELTFFNPSAYGATRRFNFDFYTRAFGLKSPKSEGIDGSKVAQFFADGKILEIAEYCLRDVTATWELFVIWRNYLKY